MKLKYTLIPFLLVLLVSITRAEKAKKAPPFTLKDLEGNSVTLDSLLGNGLIIIDFWATWCKPCSKALDMLQKLYAQYADSGLQVLAITVDSPDKISRIKSLVSSKEWSFPILLDPEKEVKILYKVMALPTLFVVDQEGKIVYTHVGYNPREKEKLEELILSLLKENEDSTDQRELK